MKVLNSSGVEAIGTCDAGWMVISKDLAGVRLEEGSFNDAVFDSCDLSKCNIKSVTFKLCRFSNCRFAESRFSNCRFIGCIFEQIAADHASFHHCNFAGCQFEQINIEGGSLENSLIGSAKARHIELYWTNLYGLTVIDSACLQSTFANPMFHDTTLIRVDLRSSKMIQDNLGTMGDSESVLRVDVLGCNAEPNQDKPNRKGKKRK